MPATTSTNAIYDLANRLTSWNGAAVSHDNNGNLTSDCTFTYTYNPRNQLTLVKQGTQTRGSFTYDGLGRRVVRTVGGATTKPAYDGWNLVQERASNGSVSANYLIGLGLDQPFLRTAGSSTSYYLSDALGSIVGLASSTGTVPTSYTYEPYGKTTVSGTSSASFFGFTGRENDSTGTLSLYNYRARAYSPTLHRFLREDPLGLGSADINLYQYASGRPTMLVDSLGLSSQRPQCEGISCIDAYEWTVLIEDALAFGFSFAALVGLLFLSPYATPLLVVSISFGWGAYLTGAFYGLGGFKEGGWRKSDMAVGAATNALGTIPGLFGFVISPEADFFQLLWDTEHAAES
jgi:RHS repeat-associated protein